MAEAEEQTLSTVLVVTPDSSDPAAKGVEEAHVTLAYIGGEMDPVVLDSVRAAVEQIAEQHQPFQMSVSGAGYLGPDKARVLLLESEELKEIRDVITRSEAVLTAIASGEGKEYPFYIPHMTLSYDQALPQEWPDAVSGAALGLWVNGEKESWDLTGHLAPPELDVVVPIQSAADLDLGIRVASINPCGRWYVAKRASALGLEYRLPAEWGAA